MTLEYLKWHTRGMGGYSSTYKITPSLRNFSRKTFSGLERDGFQSMTAIDLPGGGVALFCFESFEQEEAAAPFMERLSG